MLRTVTLPNQFTRGNLHLCAMPGRLEALEIFLQEIAETGTNNILCLVSDEEIAHNSPDYLTAIQRDEIPGTLWRYAIPDYCMPENPDDLDQMLELLHERLDHGESVVIHCAAGHGRAGMVSIRLLVRMGMPLEQATETIRIAGSAPDTKEQRLFIHSRVDEWESHRGKQAFPAE